MFQEFILAYSQNSGGAEHDLVIIFKGFKDNRIPAEYTHMLEGLRYAKLFVADTGFDIRPYRTALESFAHPFFCFLNSFSRPLDRYWLAKLNGYVRLPAVGLVGASGSWESMYSNALGQGEPGESVSFAARLWRPFRRISCKLFFKPFPNYHVRTNAFIISRALALQCWPRFIPTKRTAYLFEAGKSSLTAQVMSLGLDVLVVGRDGRGYAKEDWASSRTYRAGQQENLLVADTQTKRYEESSFEMRHYLAHVAWGVSAPNLTS